MYELNDVVGMMECMWYLVIESTEASMLAYARIARILEALIGHL